MPRGVKKPSNQHNSRHENGVVAPGRRITKQKSNGHINGEVESTSYTNGVSLSNSTAHTTNRILEKRHSGPTANGGLGLQTVDNVNKRSTEAVGDDLGVPPDQADQANGSIEPAHRKIDVNAAKNPMVHDNSMLHLATTVLRSCPLGDTIAILIFLLSLHPTIVTVSNALFAVLTFITPTGVSGSSLPLVFQDIFQGFGGTPSLATIFLTDVIGLVLWMVMWTPVQTLSIELAQAVVATTIGGGTASKKKGTDRTLLCMSIVTASHVARNQWLPTRALGFDWSAILSSIPYVSKEPLDFSRHEFMPARSPGGWFRILIALHILVQGLVHVARRWYQKREYSQAISVSKKADPEVTAGSPNRMTPKVLSEVSSSSTTALQDNVSRPLVPLPKEQRDKVLSGKKKRKQCMSVRSQQPLWAAIAHTKVQVLREYEQSHNQSEVAVSGATDIKNLGNAPFELEEECVWISNVLPTSFRFDTSFLPGVDIDEAELSNINVTAAGVDRSKPLYVRVNDTDWSSTAIEANGKPDEDAHVRWTGEVFGLTPSSSYKCSFVLSEDGVEIHSAIITTPPSLNIERGMSFFPRSCPQILT